MIEMAHSDIKAAARQLAQGTSKVKIGQSLYYLEVAGSSLKLFHVMEELGFVRGSSDNGVAKVENIEVNGRYRRQGLGTLLAACFFAYWEAKGASKARLGTTDTSGTFWNSLGLSQQTIKDISDVYIKIGPVVDVPNKPVPQQPVDFKRNIYI